MTLNILIAILCIAWFVRTVRAILFHLSLWQRNEYRFDRYFNFLFRTDEGSRLLTSPQGLAKWAILGALPFLFSGAYHLALFAAAIIIFLQESFDFGAEVTSHRLKRPQITSHSIILAGIILALTIGVGVALWPMVKVLSIFSGLAVVLLVTDRAIPIVTFAAIAILKPYKALQAHQAAKTASAKLTEFTDLKKIGITGSYGKSSTKEFLAHILQGSFKTFKTPKNINTRIGVARVIAAKLKKSHEVAVVEMGAYTKGEVKAVCDLVHPSIGTLTAVAPQHLALFGSLQNIATAKFELLRSLPEDGTAIVNIDNTIIAKNIKSLKSNVVSYSTYKKADVYASQIETHYRYPSPSISFTLHHGSDKRNITVPLIGIHTVSNIVAASAVALTLGVSMAKIQRALKSVEPSDTAMRIRKGINDSIVIDDSYSSNPDGVIAAVNTLAEFQGNKKIVVMSPLIELGNKAEEEHTRIAKHLLKKGVFQVIVTKPDVKKIFDEVGVPALYFRDTQDAINHMQSLVESGDVTLVASRISNDLMNHI